MSILTVRAQIRFGLEQLKPQNKHHVFEDIAREFSRQRICKNILPATGPVSSGGDQGRDFETYKTYISDIVTIPATQLFEGITINGNLFFACSLQKEIFPKIKSDIKSIFAQTSERRPIIYFCVEDVAVAKRNELIQWCQTEFCAELQIFDGQALSENLSDADIFWIAVEFLNIPADIYPKPTNVNKLYAEYRERWIEQALNPVNVSDFCQIKYGLRKATFHENLKPDLPAWMMAMTKLLGNGNYNLKRKVQYEVCVAALRGQHNLTPYKDTVMEYFKDIEEISDPRDLTDIGILLSYCSSAKDLEEFDIDAAYLHKVSKQFVACVDLFLGKINEVNNRCLLLGIRAKSCFLQFLQSETPTYNIDEAFKYWTELIQSVEQAPLFPLEQFSDVLDIMTHYIGTDPRFLELTTTLDELLAKRVGGFTAAEKCRDRAIAFYDNGQIIHAIDHLHRAKVNWFSAETIRGTILASCLIAECYSQLGLMYAAKYYYLSSSYMALESKDESVRDLISKSLFQAAETFYKSGEWLSFFSIIQVALLAHHRFDHEPLNILEHESLRRIFFYSVIARVLSARFWKPASKLLEENFSEWALDPLTREQLEKLMSDLSKDSVYINTPIEEMWAQFEKEFSGKPLCDIGETRIISWKALGIDWSISFFNDYELTGVAEEFVAVLQVVLVDLAQEDFQLLPLSVKINIFLSENVNFHAQEKFHNERLEWDIHIPGINHHSSNGQEDYARKVFSYATSILGFCSTLGEEEFFSRIENALKKGLSNKTFFARSYQNIYREFIPRNMFKEDERKQLKLVEKDRSFKFFEHEQLTWCKTPGLFFSLDEALEHVRNRYNRLSKIMGIIWPKILASPEHRLYFLGLHEQGYKDWHIALIACNAVSNHLAQKKHWRGMADEAYRQAIHETIMSVIDGEMEGEIHELNVAEVKVAEFKNQESLSFVSMMKTLNLCIHTPTPDFKAIKRFMGERYKVFDVDVTHEALFPE